MGAYQPLFAVSVGHQYFSDGLWKGLDFRPEPRTSKLIESADMVVKKTRNGIAVFYDADKPNILRLCAEDGNGALRFCYLAAVHDRAFTAYTAYPATREGVVLYFSNRGAEGGGATQKLSKGDVASDMDLADAGVLIAGGVPCEMGRATPDFVVDIFVERAKSGVLAAQNYAIEFSARQSYLKYYLLGNMNRDNLFIVDLDNRVEFEFCGDAMLPGERPCKVFRSKGAIPILEKSGLRFQLRERGQGAGKVLIKRLPVASESRLGMELVNGKREIVSESFINF